MIGSAFLITSLPKPKDPPLAHLLIPNNELNMMGFYHLFIISIPFGPEEHSHPL